MEDVLEIYEKGALFSNEIGEMKNEFEKKLHKILFPDETPLRETTNLTPQPQKKRSKRLTTLDENDESIVITNLSRTKNSTLLEAAADSNGNTISSFVRSPKSSTRNVHKNASETLSSTKKSENKVIKSASELMPPPIAPTAVVNSSISDLSHTRPQRAAKLNCEKNLKEPSLHLKLRRPTNEDVVGMKIKLEHEQRVSQMHESNGTEKRITSTSSTVSQDSVVAMPTKVSIVSLVSDTEETKDANNEGETSTPSATIKKSNSNESLGSSRNLRVRIKREKVSLTLEKPDNSTETKSNHSTQEPNATNVESSIAMSVLTTTAVNSTHIVQSKKVTRKNRIVPKPIKVERFSDVDGSKTENSVASRTRQKAKSLEKSDSGQKTANVERSDVPVNEEALQNATLSENQGIKEVTATPLSLANANETVTIPNSTMILGSAPNDATYCTASAATFIMDRPNSQNSKNEGSDLTFNVAIGKGTDSQRSSIQSMETARDTLQPHMDSLITEDESFGLPETPLPASKKLPLQTPQAPKVAPKPNATLLSSTKKIPILTKSSKMPSRTFEIFNPLVQSPVKKKVEAYENAAAAQAASVTGTMKRTRSKAIAEINAMGSSITPLIGKLTAPALGRFLTPTQSSNQISNIITQTKKVTASASKAQPIAKSSSAGNLKGIVSSAKALSRANSAEDFRKGLHQMAEERKKQREQKHLLAAQQREAKERERAERTAKLAKEREEKRLKKQQEAEQKKRELDEIQKKLRAQEEAAAREITKQKTKLVLEQERALLQQMKQQPGPSHAKSSMPPPQSKIQSKYTFEMLHEDDSTDDESKTSYKRPPPPTWSRSNVRGPFILQQQVMPTSIIDSFFSIQPMTPDLKTIFPAIDPRHLKRNSSVLWSTPPRYSELPKY